MKILDYIRRLFSRISSLSLRLSYHWKMMKIGSHWSTRFVLNATEIISFLASVVGLVALTAYIGYDNNVAEQFKIGHIFRTLQWLFAARLVLSLILDYKETMRNTRMIKWIVNIWLLLTLWPLVFKPMAAPWFPAVHDIVHSRLFMLGGLAAFSLLEFCYGIMRMLGRRTNPPLILATSFLAFIILGSFLLTMPKCTLVHVDFIDALFVSTSAVCITGLSTLDIASTFTPFGQAVLALLIQIGGLGVLTFTSFFALFFTGGQSVYSQLLVKDMIYSKSMNSLLPTLLYILTFTLIVEGIGAVAIWFSIHDVLIDLDMTDQIKTAMFLSLSSFCNAGFSTLPDGMANTRLMNSDQSIYLIVSAIVFAGSIGFPVLVNFRDACGEYIRRLWCRIRGRRLIGRQVRLYNVNTKISVYTSLIILIVSTVAFWLLERENTLADFSAFDRWAQALFNATVPRSSGFQSVAPGRFMPATLIMVMFLMWVGGASQSTAGGVKVNTLATLWLSLKNTVLGREHVTAFNRTISPASIQRAMAVVTLSVLFFMTYTVLLLIMEPNLPAKGLVFEIISALFTVGSSLGVTASLSAASKVLLCTAMFLGRVGTISLLIGVTGNRSAKPVQYPIDNVIIN